MEALIDTLKGQIIQQLNLVHLTKDDIKADAPLFGKGLGLDSIDAIELSVLLEKNYGLKITNPREGQKIFQSINTMAQYISENKK